MLVLSRKVGEQIVIGEDIVLTVVDVRGDTVRLGIAAPRHVTVNRAEVLRAVEEANRDAARADDADLDALRNLRPPTPED
ncbi:carbon storage regulator CsrA [Georgenia satyanarayanai]|uniref:carbon storage regulator CsrA n=1 Tax=Georgenia satyanarayanai TaxID=860221 RepID=UPI0012657084|nr:carbon storage regulator CsrA [Georgenia satyanarayanai]